MQTIRNTQVLATLAFVFTFALGCQKGSDPGPTTSISASGNSNAATGPSGNALTPTSSTLPTTNAAQSAEDAKHPIYRIETSKGNIDVRLDLEKAPITVNNFREYVNRGHYVNTVFHQVVKDPVQVVIGGSYSPEMVEKKALSPIRSEAYNGLKNHRGTVAMARGGDDVNSATSMFFFNLADNAQLDFKARNVKEFGYCVFGEVVAGLEIVEAISQGSVHEVNKVAGVPTDLVVIRSVKQLR